jgi:hypothetical protein
MELSGRRETQAKIEARNYIDELLAANQTLPRPRLPPAM